LAADDLHDQGVVSLAGEVPVEVVGIVDDHLRGTGAEDAVRMGLQPRPEAREGERRGGMLDALLGGHGGYASAALEGLPPGGPTAPATLATLRRSDPSRPRSRVAASGARRIEEGSPARSSSWPGCSPTSRTRWRGSPLRITTAEDGLHRVLPERARSHSAAASRRHAIVGRSGSI